MKHKIEYQETLENRNYKSTLFPELFKEKKELLQLFNAVNKTDYHEEEVLKEFLIKRKSEVLEMVLFSFDKELYEADLKKIAYEEGREEGRTLGELEKLKMQVIKKREKGYSVSEIAEMLEEEETVIQKIVDNEIGQR